MSQETLLRIECIRCGAPVGEAPFHAGCPLCAARDEHANFRTVYDLEKARPAFKPDALVGRPTDMWRYEAILTAQELIVENEGMFPETTSATALAALIHELETGRVPRDAEVVIVMTSTGLKSLNVTARLRPKVPMAQSEDDFSATLEAIHGFEPQIH